MVILNLLLQDRISVNSLSVRQHDFARLLAQRLCSWKNRTVAQLVRMQNSFCESSACLFGCEGLEVSCF